MFLLILWFGLLIVISLSMYAISQYLALVVPIYGDLIYPVFFITSVLYAGAFLRRVLKP